MQVRADTRSCEAFMPIKPPPKPQAAVKPAAPPTPKRAEPQRAGLCNWGRTILVAALIIIILGLAFGAYTCFSSGGSSTPTPTPTPTPTSPPPPTGIELTPSPTPTPIPIAYYEVGTWVQSSRLMVDLISPEKVKHYENPGPWSAPPGTSFIFITVTASNIGSINLTVGANDFYLVDSKGIVYHRQLLHNAFSGAYPQQSYTLAPGRTVSGKIIFVVPDSSSGLEARTVLDGYIIGWKLPW